MLLLARLWEESEGMIQMVLGVVGECGLKIIKGKKIRNYYLRELNQRGMRNKGMGWR